MEFVTCASERGAVSMKSRNDIEVYTVKVSMKSRNDNEVYTVKVSMKSRDDNEVYTVKVSMKSRNDNEVYTVKVHLLLDANILFIVLLKCTVLSYGVEMAGSV
jgi:hypothetical protein